MIAAWCASIGSGANSFFIAFQLAISCGQFFKMPAKTLFLQPSFRSQRHSFRYLHQSPYREDIVNEAGKTVRRRRGINLGSVAEVKTERAAQQKLAVILEPINDAKHRPKKMMTFRGFIEKYRTLKLANKKGTTVHGYETNIRAHYLPEFGDMQLSEISIEAVQAFIN
jgi:hypothetical protein